MVGNDSHFASRRELAKPTSFCRCPRPRQTNTNSILTTGPVSLDGGKHPSPIDTSNSKYLLRMCPTYEVLEQTMRCCFHPVAATDVQGGRLKRGRVAGAKKVTRARHHCICTHRAGEPVGVDARCPGTLTSSLPCPPVHVCPSFGRPPVTIEEGPGPSHPAGIIGWTSRVPTSPQRLILGGDLQFKDAALGSEHQPQFISHKHRFLLPRFLPH